MLGADTIFLIVAVIAIIVVLAVFFTFVPVMLWISAGSLVARQTFLAVSVRNGDASKPLANPAHTGSLHRSFPVLMILIGLRV